MPRHLRFQSTEWSPHLITARCTQGQGLLRPEGEVNALIAGALARALEQHSGEVELHHYVFMSNHLHLLLSTRDAHAKARFMCHLSGNLARELCRYWGIRDHLWEGRYHSHELLDEEALMDAYKYIFKNSVKEGLVSHPAEWPGLHGYAQLCAGAAGGALVGSDALGVRAAHAAGARARGGGLCARGAGGLGEASVLGGLVGG